jgi:hypothetical protein
MSMPGLPRFGLRCWWAVRWFGVEFLRLAVRRDMSSLLSVACRVIGCAAIGGVLWLTLSGGLVEGLAEPAIQYVASMLLAVALGNVAREFAISCCAQVMSWMGRDFTRRGATLDGKTYVETQHPDGTWIRCVSGPEGTVCEWTDTYGACNKVITGPRKDRPPR